MEWKKFYPLFGLALFSVVFLAGILFLSPTKMYSEAQTIGYRTKDFKELSGRFEELAEKKGGAYAYRVLALAQLPLGTDLHLLGHTVGDVLYVQEGVDGIATCTQEFRNACSHSIVVGALNEFGESALPLIRDACKKAPGGTGAYTMCFHGLGHGVFAYYGYSFPETISFCKTTGTAEYFGAEARECVGGAVMELMGGGGHDKDTWERAREQYLDAKNPLSLCRDGIVPKEFSEICFMYLTPFIWESSGMSISSIDESVLPKAFAQCATLKDSGMRASCVGGFGKEFVPIAGGKDIRAVDSLSDEQYKTAIRWCSYADSEADAGACLRNELSSVFWGGENDSEASLRFCGLLESERGRAFCFTSLAEDIARFIPDEAMRTALCSRIPQKQQGSCTKSL